MFRAFDISNFYKLEKFCRKIEYCILPDEEFFIYDKNNSWIENSKLLKNFCQTKYEIFEQKYEQNIKKKYCIFRIDIYDDLNRVRINRNNFFEKISDFIKNKEKKICNFFDKHNEFFEFCKNQKIGIIVYLYEYEIIKYIFKNNTRLTLEKSDVKKYYSLRLINKKSSYKVAMKVRSLADVFSVQKYSFK